MNNNVKETYKQMKIGEFVSEINDSQLVLELITFSTQSSHTLCCANSIPVLFKTVDLLNDIDFRRRVVNINGMAIPWDIFYNCEKDNMQDALKHPKAFRFGNCRWRNDEEMASLPIQLYP